MTSICQLVIIPIFSWFLSYTPRQITPCFCSSLTDLTGLPSEYGIDFFSRLAFHRISLSIAMEIWYSWYTIRTRISLKYIRLTPCHGNQENKRKIPERFRQKPKRIHKRTPAPFSVRSRNGCRRGGNGWRSEHPGKRIVCPPSVKIKEWHSGFYRLYSGGYPKMPGVCLMHDRLLIG